MFHKQSIQVVLNISNNYAQIVCKNFLSLISKNRKVCCTIYSTDIFSYYHVFPEFCFTLKLSLFTLAPINNGQQQVNIDIV